MAGSLPEVVRLHLRGLESQAQSKLKLAHAIGRTWGGVRFNIGDLAVAGAIDTRTAAALVLVEAENGVVEYVIGVHTELELDLLIDREVFGQSCISAEETGPTKTVIAAVPDMIESGVGKSVQCPPICQERIAICINQWGEESYLVGRAVETAGSNVE